MKHWNTMTADERIDRVRTMDGQGVERIDQAARFGIAPMTLARFCSENIVTAANDNHEGPWQAPVEERKTTIQQMILDDFSGKEIAEHYGITTGALRMFCERQGIVGNSQRRIRIDGPPMVPAKPVPEETWAVLVGATGQPVHQPVDLMKLEDGMCKWPVDVPEATKQHFCGCPAHGVGESYCETHAHVARHGMGREQ